MNSAMITAHKYISRNILVRSKRNGESNWKTNWSMTRCGGSHRCKVSLSFSVLPRRQIYLNVRPRTSELGIDLLHIWLGTFGRILEYEIAFGTQELINRFEFVFCILLSATAAYQTAIHRIHFHRNVAVDQTRRDTIHKTPYLVSGAEFSGSESHLYHFRSSLPLPHNAIDCSRRSENWIAFKKNIRQHFVTFSYFHFHCAAANVCEAFAKHHFLFSSDCVVWGSEMPFLLICSVCLEWFAEFYIGIGSVCLRSVCSVAAGFVLKTRVCEFGCSRVPTKVCLRRAHAAANAIECGQNFK